MATTTNYTWTTPDNTAYVKDGASAIRTLGSSVDTTLFTALGGAYPGLRRIGSVTASNASSVDITSCFSATYQNYHIEAIVTGASNGNTGIGFQMLVGSTPTGGTPWAFGSFYCDGAGGTGNFVNSNASASGWIMQAGFHTSNRVPTASVDLRNPFTVSARTSYNVQSFNSYGSGNTFSFGGGFTDDTSYNGIRFLAQAGGTFSGTFRVYGYGQS